MSRTAPLILLIVVCGWLGHGAADAAVTTYPGPEGEPGSSDYSVTVDGKPVFVYSADVLNGGPASFAYFDVSGSVTVEVTPKAAIQSVSVRPSSSGIVARVAGGMVTFTLSKPGNLSVEINGAERPLLLFASPPEVDPPRQDDPDVLYFGPGIHDLSVMPDFGSGKTIYIAGGAVVRARLGAGEKPIVEHNWAGNPVYANLLVFKNADKATVRGRGILDCSRLPWQSKSPIAFVNCTHVEVEGIIIKDSPSWCMPQLNSTHAHIDNVKAIGHRENSDGLNLVNVQDVLVEHCFMRTNDDEICVKCFKGRQAAGNVLVKDCVIWNERNFGIGVTYETQADASGVRFTDCDMIHDWGVASLVVFVADSGTISDIRFEGIRLDDVRHQLIKVWIGKNVFGKDAERGHVRGVVFSDIAVTGATMPASELTGADPTHLVEDILIRHLTFNGNTIGDTALGRFTVNEHVRSLVFAP